MKTVNVIEMSDAYEFLGLRVFPDDEQGNKDAEKLLVDLAKENSEGHVNESQIKDDGCYKNGTYWVGLMWSDNDPLF